MACRCAAADLLLVVRLRGSSSFGCCIDSYEPYEAAGAVPIGHCHWVVTQGTRSPMASGEKLGTVTATW